LPAKHLKTSLKLSRKSRRAVLAFALVFGVRGLQAAEDLVVIHPDQIANCLKLRVASTVDLNMQTNPYYLRGDFDGDGKVDYAVAVRGRITKRNGVLVCAGNGKAFVLGADQPLRPPFSDMPRDNFFAPNWSIYSKAEINALGKFAGGGVPVVPRNILGESIAMIWEDGIALIFWDGRAFKWAAPTR
jgi:hypothetical protein